MPAKATHSERKIGGPCHAVKSDGYFCQKPATVIVDDHGYCNRHSVFDRQLGDRVELAAHTDRWMAGDRFGEIVKLPTERTVLVQVKLERSGQTVSLHPAALR